VEGEAASRRLDAEVYKRAPQPSQSRPPLVQAPREASGHARETRFDDLRHTCAALLLGIGVHPKFVQELLGHATIAITLDTYSHVLPGMGDQTATAMEDALS
jgi:integrase